METTREPLRADMFGHSDCAAGVQPFRFGDKWSGRVLRCLEQGPRRFSELRIPLHTVTPKVLTETLRAMERKGFVSRAAYDENPPRVEYRLTALGRSAIEPMNAACAWTAEHLPELLAAREGAGGAEGP